MHPSHEAMTKGQLCSDTAGLRWLCGTAAVSSTAAAVAPAILPLIPDSVIKLWPTQLWKEHCRFKHSSGDKNSLVRQVRARGACSQVVVPKGVQQQHIRALPLHVISCCDHIGYAAVYTCTWCSCGSSAWVCVTQQFICLAGINLPWSAQLTLYLTAVALH
jgi:hypothetical protein